MSMYDPLAENYEEIFPLDPGRTDFVTALVSKAGEDGRLLDVGCATGELSITLALRGIRSVGTDLDMQMIRRAREQAGKAGIPEESAKFIQGDMLDLTETVSGELGSQNGFALLTCFGNTLVHLHDESAVLRFLKECTSVLFSGGNIVIQILNYERILKNRPEKLPSLETGKIRFDRYYSYQNDGKILFSTSLLEKDSGRVTEGSVELLPLKKHRLEKLFTEAGFSAPSVSGGYDRKPVSDDDYALLFQSTPDPEM